MIRLDLGCGYYKRPGYVGIDSFVGAPSQVVTDAGPDHVLDMMVEPLPFADGQVEEVFSSHYIEHVDINRVIAESYRVLRAGGLFHAVMPYALSDGGLYPGHVCFYTDQWFRESPVFNRHFTIREFRFRRTALADKVNMPFEVSRRILMNVCDQFEVLATKREGDETCEIVETFYDR